MKTTKWCALAGATVAVCLSGCKSDGANGANGKVRFSEVVNYQETDGFDAPIATNASTLIQLQHPDTSDGVGEPSGFPELRLELKRTDGDGTGTVLPLGFSQYAIAMDHAGTWRLRAMQEGTELDTLDVQVADADHVRLAKKANVVTSSKDCASASSLDTDTVVLHKNQSVTFFAVPVDKDDKPMLGLLPLSAHTDATSVKLDVPWLIQTTQPNGFTVEPAGTMGSEVKLVIESPPLADLDHTLATKDEDQPLTCPK